MKLLKPFLLVSALLLAIPSQTFANQKKYVIGVERIQYLPYYTYDTDEYSGFARELFDMFAKDEGISFEYKVLPVRRLFKDFLKGKNSPLDFKFPDHKYWKKDLKEGKGVKYSNPVIGYIDGVMVLPKNIKKGKPDLKTLGTARGFTPWDYLGDIKNKTIKVSENNSFTGLLNQAINGRIDGAYINISVAEHNLANIIKNPGKLVFNASLPHTKSAYHLSSTKHPDMIKKFDDWMKKNEGSIASLKQKWKLD